ncbi:PREDICTED: cytochrome P450 6j1-like [Dinoponera quadriceps]|uniref:Cytochrome P450 6j1-like n=1 Tax=Dinoponera quadriceps TaxID=609295 RepID=A0A6P3WS22_DINQU|nr:PREDICTED: cytochrome P450 6j1-like [Dinoponera quadriceps]
MVILLFTFVLGSIVAAYIYLTRSYNYWRDRNIPCAKGTLPGFGHTLPLLVMRTTLVDLVQRICDPYPDSSMVGFYHQTTPALVIREPELVKTVLQTNFASFSRNAWKIDSHLDRLNAANPFFSHGDTWLISRKHMGLAFTTRNIKIFLNCIQQVCNNLENYLNDKLKENNNTIELELKSLASRYTTSVAAYTSLSVENVSFEHESDVTSVSKITELMFGTNFISLLRQTICFYFYYFKRILGISYVSAKIQDSFFGFIKEIVHIRLQEKNTRKFDFLQLMLDLKETENLDYNVMSAHVSTFFMNMHDTSTVTLCFAAYEIARHPHVQQKIREEVRTVLAKYDGQLSYYALKEMTYIDQVINESQRLYPILPCMGKICTEEFELKSSDGLSCRIHPGTEIFVNVYEIHRNPKYWPNPEVFDPDRFSSDRKTEIKKYTYLPFGEGPRICVAMRIAMLQTKAYLAMIIKNYTLELSSKTPKEPLKFMPGSFHVKPISGLWVHLKPL